LHQEKKLNPPQFFKGQEPDNMVKNFYAEQGEVLSLDEFTNKVKYDIKYATKFAIHIMDYRRKNPKSYGPDPFDAWTTYKEYIKPNMKNLGATDTLVFKNGLDAEITEAIGYIKNYNDIEVKRIYQRLAIMLMSTQISHSYLMTRKQS
jgi:hypothetical protein